MLYSIYLHFQWINFSLYLLCQDEFMKMIFEIVCHPCAAMTIIHCKESKLGVTLKVGEGCTSVLVGLLVSLQYNSHHYLKFMSLGTPTFMLDTPTFSRELAQLCECLRQKESFWPPPSFLLLRKVLNSLCHRDSFPVAWCKTMVRKVFRLSTFKRTHVDNVE